MTSIVNNSLTKVAALVVAVSMVAGFAFTFTASRAEAATLTDAQISSIISLLQSFGADASTIANVDASLRGTAPTGGSTGGSMTGSCTFTGSLTIGSKGAEVTCLQNALIAAGYSIPAGATGYFGTQTQSAVAAWQKASNVNPPAGYFGPISQAAFKLGGSSTGGSTGGGTTPAGTGLTVAAGSQPQNSLSPQGATRVPFTRFTLSAGNDGDVVVNGVTVQKDGLGQDAAFAGVVLIDESNNTQVGVAKTFNSNHQTVVGGTFTIPRGTTKTFLLAGNMNSALLNYVGEAPGLALVAVNTSATVSGSLPIVGAHHVNNNTLSVGTLALDVSNSFASNANQSKEIGTTGYKFTGFRLTAGSSEDVRLRTITFNQAGSASANDIANVMVTVGGTSYPTSVSSDGRYYTANLGSGVVIAKGNQADVYISADIIGSNASGRTVIFDVDKTTDIYGTGETYNYGISPSVGSSAVPASRTTTGLTTETSGTPYIYAAQVSVSGASITTIGKANEVAAQNIAINLSNQPLGGYVVDLKGEDVTVQSQVFAFTVSSTLAGSLTNITIVDENGSVVSGPVDATSTCATTCSVSFSDTITYKTGRHVYTLRGKIPSTATNGTTIVTATTPSSGWTTVRGATSGNTISLSGNGAFSMNTMTVKAGAVAVGRANSPASQNITPGGSQVLFANFQYDATQSGEDIRFSSIPATLSFGSGAGVTELTSCAAYDGATQLSTGSNVINPSGNTGDTQTITLDSPVTVAKGTVKTIGIKCNVSGSATDTGTWAWDAGAASAYTFTGATSGTTITNKSDTSDTVVTMTVSSGSATVALDASSPSFTLAAAGATDVTVGALKFRSANEDLNLRKVGLKLTNTASSSSADLVKVTIWDGATQVGEAYFTGSNTTATSTLSSVVTLAKNTDKTLTIKANFQNVGTGEPVTFSGHLVAVDFLNAEGSGVSSGTTIYPTGSSSTSGVRVFKSFPTFALDSTVNGTTGLADGRLMRFKVTADAKGPVGIAQFAINLATTTASVTNVTIYGFTDSGYSQAISGVTASGDLQATVDATVAADGNVVIGVTTAGGTPTAIQVPAGQTRYFEVRGSISGSATGAAVTTKLLGSSSFPSTAATVGLNPLLAAAGVTGNVFVWSPNSTTTAVVADQDWTNGFGVPGLSAGGLFATRSH